MSTSRRATIYLDADLHRALRLKAAETDKSVSDLVNEAVRQNLTSRARSAARSSVGTISIACAKGTTAFFTRSWITITA
jgi:plasmid stability protein